MSDLKKYLDTTVLEEASKRISWTFDNFEHILISFSGGKDSTVMLHLVMNEAIRRNRKVGLLFIDWEAQYKLTISHVEECFKLYEDHIIPLWVCLPLLTTNSVSSLEPEWICWEKGKEDLWVRDYPENCIKDYSYFSFYNYAMTFEEFISKIGDWFGNNQEVACFVGIRTDESLNRFRTINNKKKIKKENKIWTTLTAERSFNIYPIYDWTTKDIWVYLGKSGNPYNKLYDRMHQAGLKLSQMRICEPYGDEQKKGLWLFHIIEPETWNKIVARVAGVNSGSEFFVKNTIISKPDNQTWKSYVKLLLNSMPLTTSEHYKNKISVYLNWWKEKENVAELPDELPGDLGSNDLGTWRRICKTLLKNDYWCKTLSFSPTKTSAYKKYLEFSKKRREKWKLI